MDTEVGLKRTDDAGRLTLARSVPTFTNRLNKTGQGCSMIAELNDRSREILRMVVEGFVDTGEPVGSRTLSRRNEISLSPATIRNVMSDLEDAGLLYAPHTSAGRLPTNAGLKLFVDGLLQLGNLTAADRTAIETQCDAQGRSLTQVLEEASGLMSGLGHCAGLVTAPKSDKKLKHIEFVPIGPGRALVVMVDTSGMVENRLIDLPIGLPPASLIEATNFLTATIIDKTLDEARHTVDREVTERKAEIDTLTQKVVEQGLATWADTANGGGALIISGQANLLEDISGMADLERIRALFTALERKESLLRMLDSAQTAEGVQIFIGAENELFSLAGCSMVVAPYKDSESDIIGAIGVVGPTRMNYARIIPMVDYTAKVVGRLLR